MIAPLIAQPILLAEADVLNMIESPIGTERQLTDREIEALTLLANGKCPKQIAEEMNCSYKSILRLSSHAREVLGVQTTVHAVAVAVKRKLIVVTDAERTMR